MIAVRCNYLPAASLGDALNAAEFLDDPELVDLAQVVPDIVEMDLSVLCGLGIPD